MTLYEDEDGNIDLEGDPSKKDMENLMKTDE